MSDPFQCGRCKRWFEDMDDLEDHYCGKPVPNRGPYG